MVAPAGLAWLVLMMELAAMEEPVGCSRAEAAMVDLGLPGRWAPRAVSVAQVVVAAPVAMPAS